MMLMDFPWHPHTLLSIGPSSQPQGTSLPPEHEKRVCLGGRGDGGAAVSFWSHLFFFKCLFIFERERQSMSGGGAEREGDPVSEAGSRL